MYSKLIVLLTSLFIMPILWAEENISRELINTPVPVIISHPKINNYERKLLERTKKGMFLVQDFYDSGEKLTDPYFMSNPLELVALNLFNKRFEEISPIEDFYYHFLNVYLGRSGLLGIDGKLVSWHKNGNKRSEEFYQQGVPIHKLTLWYEDGVKAREINYSTDGKGMDLAGTLEYPLPFFMTSRLPLGVITSYKSWYPNAQLWEDSDFNNEKNYVIRKWYENGQKKIEHSISSSFNPRVIKTILIKQWDVTGKELPNDDKILIYKRPWRGSEYKIIKNTLEGYLIQEFYENGKKASEPFLSKYKPGSGSYSHCVDGKVIYYDIDGNKLEERICNKNDPKATFVQWYSSGEVRGQGSYEIGEDRSKSTRVGIWKRWHINGQLESEVDHDHPNKLSNFISYYDNGQIKAGKKNGVTVEYGTNPLYYILKERPEKSSDLIHTYYKGNKKLLEYDSHDGGHGERFGKITEWHDNGQVAAQGEFNLGSKFGDWKYYYESGQLWMQGKHNGKQVGIWAYWDEKGNKVEVNKGD